MCRMQIWSWQRFLGLGAPLPRAAPDGSGGGRLLCCQRQCSTSTRPLHNLPAPAGWGPPQNRNRDREPSFPPVFSLPPSRPPKPGHA
ncbi:hypothetical protein B0T11DRAFT_271165 [Plectosphaerella cucumerina]|uniref:Uncharacterized protein n=1 Tax=Plectosphaerella cucumerina TaxID=40658 RepID=A0A8K0TTV7_9PEZI|nr:hypothetical protein B0T11DRAFT_271165 [Plectosphaerella cucumerina]